MSEVIFLQNVRLSFPHLTEKHASADNAKPKYSGDFLMTADHKGYQEFMKKYGEIAAGKWHEHAENVMIMIHSDRKLRCYGAGEEKVNKKTFAPYDGYVGQHYLTASNENMPQMIKPDGSVADPLNTMECMTIARTMYGGCYVNVALKPWPQENAHGRGIRCDLVAIQFYAEGESFGEGATDASNMFGAVAGAPAGAASPAGAAAPPIPGMSAAEPKADAPTMPGLPPFLQ